MKYSAFAALFALALAGASPATAQIRFSGTTAGCFGDNCTPTQFSGVDFIRFVGSSFDDVTRDGSINFMDLGSFYWDYFEGSTILDTSFTLFLSFAQPTGISPDPTYYSDLEGYVIRGKVNGVRTGESDVYVTFEPNQREYTFTGGEPDKSGAFTLTINDTYIRPNGGSQVVGSISGATVTPEPMSMILMGSGLAGLAAARRRRKRQQTEEV